MIQLVVKTEEHVDAMNAMTRLYETSIQQEKMDPDVFMESCLIFAVAYHMEFSQLEVVDELIRQVRSEIEERNELSTDAEISGDDEDRTYH